MVVLARIEGEVTVTSDPWPSLFADVEVADAGAFFIDLEVDERAAVAFAQRFQRFGVRVDLGGATLPDREVADALTIDEDAERFGDILTFRLAGPRFSPFARDLLRARTPVGIYFTTGSPLNEFTAKVFTGWVMSATHDVQPPASNVTALDAAGLYARRRALDYILPPNSGKTRGQVARELLSIGAIPIRALDLGSNDGGTVTKPFSPGDRPILDALRDYLGVLGCEVALIDAKFVAMRYNPNAPIVAELDPSNLLVPLSFASPETLSPNVLGVVSVKYTRIEPNGERTEETSVTTVANYAKGVWAFRQTVIEGEATLTPNIAGPPAASPKVVSEVTTRTTYFGSIEKHMEQEEKGWYAFRGTPNRIAEIEEAPFYELQPLDAYIFADGSTRADSAERFQTIRRTVRDKTLDEENRVIASREERYFPRFHRRGLWIVGFDPMTGLSETLLADLALINDDGDGVIGAEEIGRYGPDEITELEIRLNDDGTILEEVTTERFYTVGSKRPRAANAVGYGIDPRTYTNRTAEAISPTNDPSGERVTTKRYRVISEDRYEVSETVFLNGVFQSSIPDRPVVGSPPRPERAEAEQSSQEIRAEVADERRILWADEEIPDVEHNELIESSEEARVYARHRARLASAIVLQCTTPIEGLIHKFKMIRVNLPGASVHGKKFYVLSVRRDASTFRQDITAHYYSEELG
jgi:hypothetical protein